MAEADPTSQPQFLVLSGEGIAALDPAHIEALRVSASAMAGGRAIEATVTFDVDTVEPAAPREQQFIDLTGMAPDEVLRTYNDIHAEKGDDEDTYTFLWEAFMGGLNRLSEQAPEEAVAAFSALAQAEQDEARFDAALSIGRLVKADRGAALGLWESLLMDPNREVAETAKESLDREAGEQLSVDETLRLTRAYRSVWSATRRD